MKIISIILLSIIVLSFIGLIVVYKKYNSNDNVNLSSWLQAFATVVLVLITAWYAFSTYNMVSTMKDQKELMQGQLKIMQEDFKLSHRPWVAHHSIEKVVEDKKIAYYYKAVNIGNIPADITNIEIKASYKGSEEEKILYKKDNILQTLMPGEHDHFWCQ